MSAAYISQKPVKHLAFLGYFWNMTNISWDVYINDNLNISQCAFLKNHLSSEIPAVKENGSFQKWEEW